MITLVAGLIMNNIILNLKFILQFLGDVLFSRNKSTVFYDNINNHRLLNFENICLKDQAGRYELITIECKKRLVKRKIKICIARDQRLEDKFEIQYDVHYQPINQSNRGTLSLHKILTKSQQLQWIFL